MLRPRSLTITGFLLALLVTAASAVSAQVAPARPDSPGVREAASISRLAAGGLIGGAVGTLAPLLLVPRCAPAPPDYECSDVPRDVATGLGYLVGVPVGVHIAGGRRTGLLRPLLGTLMVSGMLGLVAWGVHPSIAYAIPIVHLVVSVGEAR